LGVAIVGAFVFVVIAVYVFVPTPSDQPTVSQVAPTPVQAPAKTEGGVASTSQPTQTLQPEPRPTPDYEALAKKYGAKDVTPAQQIPQARLREFAPSQLSHTKTAYIRPALAPNGGPWPTTSGYFSGLNQLNGGGRSNLIVDNSAGGSDVVVSVYDHIHDQSMRVFFLLAHDKFTVVGLIPGVYDVRYQDQVSGEISRSDPIGFTEVQTQDQDGTPSVHWHDTRITLYDVTNPKNPIHFEKIDASEFVKLPPPQ
jgi:hypothetical protein